MKNNLEKNEYLVKFADYLDHNSSEKEASYIDKLIVFINRDNIERNIMLKKKSSFQKVLVKIADSCDSCGSHEQADMIDSIMQKIHKMPESYMAKKQIARIHESAAELYHLIEEGEVLPDWVESKIAQIESTISSVYKYMRYEKKTYEIQR